jgi:hypothetical protein
MGCDIHLHIEVKIKNKWEHYACPHVNRWYSLFEKMAGVRGDIAKAISSPKGLPHDINRLTAIDRKRWGRDAHSCSWLDKEEIVKLEEWLRSVNDQLDEYVDLEHTILKTYLFGSSFASFVTEPYHFEGMGLQDVRFVFWFDN